MREAALRLLTSRAGRVLFRGWTRRTVPIVMYHRFSAEPRPGTVPAADLEQTLRAVRDVGLEPLSLGDLAERLAGGSVPARTICFTVDDGYRDFADVAWPLFRRYDTPVTVFATSGFVDGTMWNWWDRIRHAVASAGPGAPVRDADALIESCKEVPDERKEAMIADLERELGTALPSSPPADYAAMDWSTVRRLAGEGVEFGAHTVTHPILSKVGDERLRDELERSIAALAEATGRPVRCFAYPNGQTRDFDDRAVALLRSLGVAAAVTTEYGVVDRDMLAAADALFRLPRVTPAEDARRRMALICGLEGAKLAMSRK